MGPKRVTVGILGLGTVGTGVLRLLDGNGDRVAQAAGVRVEVAGVAVRDVHKPRVVTPAPGLLKGDPGAVVNDPGVDLVVEVMGGLEPAGAWVLRALELGKPVVTANKELVASRGRELLDAAFRHRTRLRFEASVGGGIPIIAALGDSLAGNRVGQIIGILNGTTNYILSRMTSDGVEFPAALAEAQARGYAESDPGADVSGQDAACKIAILASVAFGVHVPAAEVPREGIAGITSRDVACARELGCVIKLLASAKEEGGTVRARVFPALLPLDHPLAAVTGVFNAVWVTGDAVGETMFYGQGAGQLPTASAVVGDIIASARELARGGVFHPLLVWDRPKPAQAPGPSEAAFYFRMLVSEQPGALAAAVSVLGDQEVALARFTSRGRGQGGTEWVLVTQPVEEQRLKDALCIIQGLPAVKQVGNAIRILDAPSGCG